MSYIVWKALYLLQALSKVNLKALTNLRQRVRKYVKEFEQKIAEYRESPDPAGYETPEEEEEDVRWCSFYVTIIFFYDVGMKEKQCISFQAGESGDDAGAVAMPTGKEKKKDLSSSESEVCSLFCAAVVILTSLLFRRLFHFLLSSKHQLCPFLSRVNRTTGQLTRTQAHLMMMLILDQRWRRWEDTSWSLCLIFSTGFAWEVFWRFAHVFIFPMSCEGKYFVPKLFLNERKANMTVRGKFRDGTTFYRLRYD